MTSTPLLWQKDIPPGFIAYPKMKTYSPNFIWGVAKCDQNMIEFISQKLMGWKVDGKHLRKAYYWFMSM